ncbi:phosphoinositide phosphatase SAC6-like protein [Tanacetum coccineum]
MTVWANHGDDISIQYSGTLSLKGELVIRGIIDIFVPKASCIFGKRTPEGIFKDGWNALMRYYLNNFVDGTKQVRSSLAFVIHESADPYRCIGPSSGYHCLPELYQVLHSHHAS